MQKNINRDTCKFAFKASAIEQGRVWKGIAKDPITDPGKRSKMGKVAVVPTATGFETKTYLGAAPVNDIMKPYYINGYLPRRAELDSIRSLVDSQL